MNDELIDRVTGFEGPAEWLLVPPCAVRHALGVLRAITLHSAELIEESVSLVWAFTHACVTVLQVMLSNVTFHYYNPATLDSCEQFTDRTIFSLQQQPDVRGSVVKVDPVSFHLDQWELPSVQVLNGSDNSSGKECHQAYGWLQSHVNVFCMLQVDNITVCQCVHGGYLWEEAMLIWPSSRQSACQLHHGEGS